MRLRKRRTLWLVVLLFLVMIGAWCFMPRSRITRQNFDLITNEMTAEEVREILGQSKPSWYICESGLVESAELWEDGPNWIRVNFHRDRAKEAHFATTWGTLTWYLKKGAANIGVK